MLVALTFVSACVPQNAPGQRCVSLNPPSPSLRSISICSGTVRAQQDPRFLTLLPYQAQQLPLNYCASWPIWVTTQGGKLPVTRVPLQSTDSAPETTWVPPATFEDLPVPRALPAVGMVLRNGEPRYVFPTLDTYLNLDGVVWRNRGLNSVPLAKTWLDYGQTLPEALQLSAYFRPLSAEPEDAAEESEAQLITWQPCLDHRSVEAAIDAALSALNDLPAVLRKTSLGEGFCYLISPLPGSESLPESALAAGNRLRVFLSDMESWPTNVARDLGEDVSSPGEDRWAWQRGELDLTVWQVPSGKDSPYMPKPYEPLYTYDW